MVTVNTRRHSYHTKSDHLCNYDGLALAFTRGYFRLRSYTRGQTRVYSHIIAVPVPYSGTYWNSVIRGPSVVWRILESWGTVMWWSVVEYAWAGEYWSLNKKCWSLAESGGVVEYWNVVVCPQVSVRVNMALLLQNEVHLKPHSTVIVQQTKPPLVIRTDFISLPYHL